MIRAVAAAMLVLLACPVFAQKMTKAELNDLYNKWQAEENRTLEGWRVLDDVTLIERLSRWMTDDEATEQKDEDKFEAAKLRQRAAGLLCVMYQYGVGGAPTDTRASGKYLRETVSFPRLNHFVAQMDARFSINGEGQIVVEHSPNLFGFGQELMDYGEETAPLALIALAYLQDPAGGPDTRDAIWNLRTAGKAGCLPAKVVYARELYRGTHLKRDVPQAQQILEEEELADYLPALMERARFHDFHNGVRPSLKLQRKLLEQAAQSGCMGAARRLSELPSNELEELTVDALYQQYISRWARTKEDRTVQRERILTFESNPVLAAYPDVAQWLRPFADPENDGDYSSLQVARARCMLGECLLHSIGGADFDFEEGISLLRAAWTDESLPAAGLLCSLHLMGNLKADPERECFAMFEKTIDAGFAPAERLLALANLQWDQYIFKLNVDPELWMKATPETFRRLAEDGDPESLERLIRLTDDLKWRRIGAEFGLPVGMLEYAKAIRRGEVEGATDEQANQLFRRCLGYPETHEDAKKHFEYLDAAPSAARALELTEKLALSLNETGDYQRFLDDHPYAIGVAQRSFEAGHQTGELYALCVYEKHGITIRTDNAQEILLSYPDSALAVYLSGRLHENDGDVRSAVWCYEAAAQVGAGYAAWRLGTIYRVGNLKDKDDVKATQWFIKGADEDCVIAMLEAAKAYSAGLGAPKDAAKAKAWVKKAADLGNEDAKALLDEWNK